MIELNILAKDLDSIVYVYNQSSTVLVFVWKQTLTYGLNSLEKREKKILKEKHSCRSFQDFFHSLKIADINSYVADNNNDLFAAAPKPFFADKQGNGLFNNHHHIENAFLSFQLQQRRTLGRGWVHSPQT